MRVITCEQGSPEWHSARAGVITASMFGVARKRVGELDQRQRTYVQAIHAGSTPKVAQELAGYKVAPKSAIIDKALRGEPVGDYSEEAKNYAFRLAVERINGEPLDEGFQTYAMKRGHDLEPMARAEHEVQSGLIVKRAGFVLSDDGVFGASADGLIGDDSGSEYKCFLDPALLRAFHIDNDASDVFEQVQGCMWITGRKEWHVGLYCPALVNCDRHLWWRVFQRDDAFIAAMEHDLRAFADLVDTFHQQLQQPLAA
ncbi:lambda exonuclease family protein [Stenotrophomonas sp. AB1(2024)]|uniref:lambda exonuclease family protein n=1 Tax=Stenotrophomonas sp. AB1(2024) TaxID=3132215 RepID=UPI0030B5BBE7